MVGLIGTVPRAHEALTDARAADLARIDEGLQLWGVTGVHGEPEVGVTSLVAAAIHRSNQGSIRIDLDGVADEGDVAWKVARGLARWLLNPIELSLMLGPAALQPTSTRRAFVGLADALGGDVASLAVAETAVPEIELAQVLDALGRAAEPAAVPPVLWIDHLQAPGLTPRHPLDVAALLWNVRSLTQRVELPVIVSGSRAATYLAAGHGGAFYGDGTWVTLGRPGPEVWRQVRDRLALGVDDHEVAELVEMTQGHPATMLLAFVLADELRWSSGVIELWQLMLSLDDGLTARAVQHARTLHRLGGRLLQQVAAGVGPYQDPQGVSIQDIHRAVRRLHAAGLITQPAPRRWAVTNPLLAARLRGSLPHTTREARGVEALDRS